MRITFLYQHSARDLFVLKTFSVVWLNDAQDAQVFLRRQHLDCVVVEIGSNDHLNKDFHDCLRGSDVDRSIECHDSAER